MDRCEVKGRCVRYFLMRRPRDEAQPLSLRAKIFLAWHAQIMSHRFVQRGENHVPPGSTLATRLALKLPAATMPNVEIALGTLRYETRECSTPRCAASRKISKQ